MLDGKVEMTTDRRAAAHQQAANAGFRQFQNLWRDTLPSIPEKLQVIVAVGVTVIAVVTLCTALYLSKPVMIPIMTAFVLSVLLAPAAHWLSRKGVPRKLAALLVVLLSLGVFIGGLYLAIKPGAAWVERLPSVIEDARGKLTNVEQAVNKVQDVSEQVSELTEIGDEAPAESVKVENQSFGATFFNSARATLVKVIFTTVLIYFFLASRLEIQRKFILLRSSRRSMLKTARMMRGVEQKVGRYMLTMLIINLGLGAATTLCMWAIGMPSPFVWGGLAAILNFVPYIGPIVLFALLSISGIVNFDAPVEMMTPAAIYVALNFIESNFVTPMLIGVRLTLSPLAVILNISFWTWLWGPAGAIISIPVLIIFKTISDYSDLLRPLGLLIGDEGTFRPTKRRIRRAKRTAPSTDIAALARS